jgi:hypothetical protein
LTLDECAAAGVPALAFAAGALGERTAAAGGLVLPLPIDGADADALVATLERLARGELALPAPLAGLDAKSPREAAWAWRTLYEELGVAAG